MSSDNIVNLSVIDNNVPTNFNGEPLIPEGEYQLKFSHYVTTTQFGGPRIVLHFTVVDMGNYFGAPLKRYYNVVSMIGKPGKNGRFKPPKRGYFLLEYLRLFPNTRTTRLDRLNMEQFKKVYIRAKVRTVTKHNLQRDLPKPLRYSVVDELLGISNE